MPGRTIWGILCLTLGVIIAAYLTSSIKERLALPNWLVFVIVYLDAILVLFLPVTIRNLYALFKIYQFKSSLRTFYASQGDDWMGQLMTKGEITSTQLLFLTLIFVATPVVVLVWLILQLG